MLLTLLQQNLEPIRARVSWLQFVALPTATLSATEGADVLTSAASAESRANISWLQFVPGTAAAVDGANAPDTLVSMASIAPPVARVSWVHFTAVPDGVYSVGSLSPDGLTASASAAITVKISWLLLEISPSLVATAAGNDSDSLFASATVRSSADPHVAGSWSPAAQSRWVVLDSPNPPPKVATASIIESGDVLTASATATPPELTASLIATESSGSLSASVVPYVVPDDVLPMTVGGPDEDSDFERAILERISHRAKLQVRRNNAAAMAVVAMLCTGEIE